MKYTRKYPTPHAQYSSADMRTFILVVCLVVSLLGVCQTNAQPALPDTIRLETLIQRATQQSIRQYTAERDLRLAQLDFQIFQADFKPQLTAFANLPNYSRSFSEVTQPDGAIAFQPIRYNNSSVQLLATQRVTATGGTVFLQSNLQRFDDFGNDAISYNGSPFRLGITQPIFAFNAWKWLRRTAPLQRQMASKQYAFEREQIRIEGTLLFFQLLIAQQDLGIARTNLDTNLELVNIAQERFELGKISENHLLQLQLEGVRAKRSKQNAAQAVRLASAEIYNYLGLSYAGQLLQARMPVQAKTLVITDEEVRMWATRHRFEYDGFLLRQMRAEQNVERAKKEAGIQMNLTASIGYSRSAAAVAPIYGEPQREAFLQVGMSVPLLDWGRNQSIIEQQQVQLDFTQQDIKRQRQQLHTELQNTVYRMQNIQQQLVLAEQLQQLAQSRFEIARQSFVLGAISTTELGIAQQEKDVAMRDYISNLRTYWVTFYELRRNTLYDFVERRPLFE